jgi:glycosyltransferase involved in cell wall biosynthesis
VVAAAAGALPETVGQAGRLVDPHDGDGFAQALVSVVGDEDVRTRLIAAGRERARGFTWDRTAELTDAAIDELLPGG